MLYGEKIRVKDLEREIEFMKKEFELERQKLALQDEQNRIGEMASLRIELAQKKAQAEQLEVRIKESPYSQLTDILKALTVKLPTLDIRELCIRGKEK